MFGNMEWECLIINLGMGLQVEAIHMEERKPTNRWESDEITLW